jgi:hypothetical protein
MKKIDIVAIAFFQKKILQPHFETFFDLFSEYANEFKINLPINM